VSLRSDETVPACSKRLASNRVGFFVYGVRGEGAERSGEYASPDPSDSGKPRRRARGPRPPTPGSRNRCPGRLGVAVANAPAQLICRLSVNAWRGITSTGVDLTAGYPLAIDDRTIASGGAGAINLFTPRPGPPSTRRASLSGLALGNPKLRFTLEAGQDAAPIRSFKLSLPGGLRFSTRGSRRSRGVHVSAPRRSANITSRTLGVALRRPVRSLIVTITPSGLTEERSLIARVQRIRRYNGTHRRKHASTLRIQCAITDATGHATSVLLKIRFL
jgi:hypothetical protein